MNTLDERILLVWLAAVLAVTSTFGLAVGVADQLFVGVGLWVGPATFVAMTFAGSLYAGARYRTFRFDCDPETLYLERGVFTRVQTVVPVAAVRRIDVRRNPAERLVGLQHLVVYVAGTPSATVAIPGLSAECAHVLQDQLQGVPDPGRLRPRSDRLAGQYGSSRTSESESS